LPPRGRTTAGKTGLLSHFDVARCIGDPVVCAENNAKRGLGQGLFSLVSALAPTSRTAPMTSCRNDIAPTRFREEPLDPISGNGCYGS
jgi:hypothetical protein